MYKEKLAHYKALIEADLIEYSQVLKDRWSREYDEVSLQVFSAYLDILSRGGKRLRGALSMYAYEMCGGEDEELSVRAARAIEMIHAYLLVVDDIADRSHLRRGGPAAQVILTDLHKANRWNGEAAHFGMSQAMNSSLAALHLVMREIAELPVEDTRKLEAQIALNKGLMTTVVGQINDINNEAIQDVDEQDIIAMMTRKTAYYSFVNPLEFGVILAGKDFSKYEWLKTWALNIGLSFQIRDDILGVFGEAKASGKSTLDDIREGKMTLIIARTLHHANEQDKALVLQALGNQDITPDEIEKTKAIIEQTGALDYATRLAHSYADKAIESLSRAPDAYSEATQFLTDLSWFIAARNN